MKKKKKKERVDAAPCASSLLTHARAQCTRGCTMRVTRDGSLWIIKIEIYLLAVCISNKRSSLLGRDIYYHLSVLFGKKKSHSAT